MVGYAGEVKLIDFGTARGHNRRCHTVAGVVFAKPGYVAPEVARQQVGDGRIDLYALGIMLWELCAGRRFLNSDPQRHLDDAAAGKVIVPPVAEMCGAPAASSTTSSPSSRGTSRTSATRAPRWRCPTWPGSSRRCPDIEGGERGVRARIALLMRNALAARAGALARRVRAPPARRPRDARGRASTRASRPTPAP